jgi:hypothetical protein
MMLGVAQQELDALQMDSVLKIKQNVIALIKLLKTILIVPQQPKNVIHHFVKTLTIAAMVFVEMISTLDALMDLVLENSFVDIGRMNLFVPRIHCFVLHQKSMKIMSLVEVVSIVVKMWRFVRLQIKQYVSKSEKLVL